VTQVEHLTHVTTRGERWDQLAYRYYGDPHRYEPIIRANPSVPITPTLPGGVRLLVPVIPPTDLVAEADLPPWKRRRS